MKLRTPSSTLTRPANTTAYVAGDLVAGDTTAGSVTVPSFEAGLTGGRHYYIPRIRLKTDKTSGMASINFTLRLWAAAPTYDNGDNGAYSVATNGDELIGAFTNAGFVQGGDGATAIMTPDVGDGPSFYLSGTATSVYWDLEIESGLTPASGQTFTAVPEVYQVG